MAFRFALSFILTALISGCFSVPSGLPQSKANPVAHRERPATLAITDPPAVVSSDSSNNIVPKSDPLVRQVVAQTPAAPAGDPVERLHAEAIAKFKEIPSFVARLRRRESLLGKQKPEELILFKERKDPMGVHFKWIGEEAKGRELLYVRGRFGDKLHIITAAGDVPFTPAGQRMTLGRDNILVKAANPNHDISEAGIDHYLRDLSSLYRAAQNPSTGVTVRYLGPTMRPEYLTGMEGVEIKIPSGRDPDVPRGGTRQVFYCVKTKLPTLYILFDENGREQHYNCYDRLQLDLPLDDHDFDPDKLWGKRSPVISTSSPKP
jgi:hypothetical protein